MTTVRQYLRQLPQSFRNGCAALRDILWWGSVYPRTIDLATLRAMKNRPS